MDFNLNKEQMDIQKAATEFARGEFDPDAALAFDDRQEFPSALWKKASELGFVGVHFPEACGGAGLGQVENVLVTEAFCRQDSGIGMALALSDFGAEIILKNGDEGQKERYLSPVAGGKEIMTLACLENGYALRPLKTLARPEGEGYLISGEKLFVPLGDMARHIIVTCQVPSDDPAAQSVLVVDRTSGGLEIRSMGRKVGMRLVPMARISLEGVHVSGEGLIGRWGGGHSVVTAFQVEMRIEAGAVAVGIAQGGLDRALDYSKKRLAFGRAIVQFDAIRNKLADMVAQVELARLVTYKAAWACDQGKPDIRLSLVTKMTATEAAYRVTNDALQIHGGQGYMKEGHIEHFYRDAKVLNLFMESAQVQKDLLADEVAGKRIRGRE